MKGILEIKDELDEIMTEFMLDTNSENKVTEIQKKTEASSICVVAFRQPC